MRATGYFFGFQILHNIANNLIRPHSILPHRSACQKLAKANVGYLCAVEFGTTPSNDSYPLGQLLTGQLFCDLILSGNAL